MGEALRVATLLAATLVLFAGGGPVYGLPGPSVIRVIVTGVTSSRGHIRVDICTRQTFLKDCVYSGAAPSVPGTTVVLVQGVPPGVYAAQVYQDKNDNHQVDRDMLGIPSEGVGFSNDAPIRLSPPSFNAAAFTYAGGEKTISLQLRRFFH